MVEAFQANGFYGVGPGGVIGHICEGILDIAVVAGDGGRAAEMVFVEIVDAGVVDFGDPHAGRLDVFYVPPSGVRF